MSYYTGDYREEVARGVALLDELKPGWRNLVNPDELEMQNGDDCILGQVFREDNDDDYHWGENGYRRGLRLLGLTESITHENNGMTSERHGFVTNWEDDRPNRWQILRAAWDEVL